MRTQPQPVNVGLMGYSSESLIDAVLVGDAAASDFQETTVNWTYLSGGVTDYSYDLTADFYNYEDGGGGGEDNQGDVSTPIGAGIGALSVGGWENASYGGPEDGVVWNGYYSHSYNARVMLEAPGQAGLGQTATYLVEAQAWGEYGSPDPSIEQMSIQGHQLVDGGDGWGQAIITVPVNANVAITPEGIPGNTGFNERATNLTMQIVDANTGNNLSAQTNTVIVGQQMNLTCTLSLANLSVSSFLWTVQGSAASNFVANGQSGTVNTSFATTSSDVHFYWIDGGTKTVQISATVDGQPVTATATFNVVRPTAKVTAYTTSINVDTFLNELGFHDNNTFVDGITFSNTITIPSGFSGTNEWVQIVLSPYFEFQTTNNISWVLSDNGSGPYLDTSYPYTNVTANIAVDSPNIGLSSSYHEVAMTNSFEMWLMFKPAGGQWVPLRTITWNCSGKATNSTTGWTLISRSWSTNPPDADAGTIFPQWNNNVRNLTFQSQP